MRTPRLMGVNLGHRAIGSNAWQFMRRMGVNAARLFLYTTIPCAYPPQMPVFLHAPPMVTVPLRLSLGTSAYKTVCGVG